MLLLLLAGLLLLRFATRQWFALLFQLPPRFTRFEPDGRRPEFFHHAPPESVRTHRQDEGRERGETLLQGLCGNHAALVQTRQRPEPPPVAHLAATVEFGVAGKDPVTEEIHAACCGLRTRRMFQCESQFVFHEALDFPAQRDHRRFVIAPTDEVVHVTAIRFHRRMPLAEAVQRAEVEIRQMLAGQAADGQAVARASRPQLFFIRTMPAQDLLQPVHYLRVFEQAVQPGNQPLLRDRLKIFPDVQLELPTVPPRRRLRHLDGLHPSLALAAGVAVKNRMSLQHRFAEIHQSVVEHPLRETRRVDRPLLGIEHLEYVEFSGLECAIHQLLSQAVQILIQILREAPHLLLPPLAACRLVEGADQIPSLDDGGPKIPDAFHDGIVTRVFRTLRSSWLELYE